MVLYLHTVITQLPHHTGGSCLYCPVPAVLPQLLVEDSAHSSTTHSCSPTQIGHFPKGTAPGPQRPPLHATFHDAPSWKGLTSMGVGARTTLLRAAREEAGALPTVVAVGECAANDERVRAGL